MNKTFKVVWSRVRNCWVVTSELAKNHSKHSGVRVIGKSVVAGVLACVFALGITSSVLAAGNAGNINSSNTSNVSGADVWQYLQQNKLLLGGGASLSGSTYDIIIGTGAKHLNGSGTTTGSGGAAIVIGRNAKVTGANTEIAIGANSEASGAYAGISIGTNAIVKSSGGVAIGAGATTNNYRDQIAIGSNARTTYENAMAIGVNSYAKSNTSLAIGNNSYAGATNAIAIGPNSTSTSGNVISVGHKAGDVYYQTSTSSEELKYTVSYTEKTYDSDLFRRISNVANGTSAHDAATVAQTHTTAVGNGLTLATSTNSNGSTKYTITPKAGTNVTINSDGINVLGGGTVASGNTGLINGGNAYTELRPSSNGTFIKTTNTTKANLTELDTAAKNAIKELSVDGSILTYTRGDNSTGNFILPSGGGANYTSGNGIEINNNIISTKNVLMYDTDENDVATLNGTRGTKLTNLKQATLANGSTDAVIGHQLWQTNQNIIGFAADINRNKNNISSLNQSVTDALTSVAAVSDLVDAVDQLKADASLNNLTNQGRAVINSAAADAVQAYISEHGGLNSMDKGVLGAGNTGLYYGVNSTGGTNQNGEGAVGRDSIAIGKNASANNALNIAIGINSIAGIDNGYGNSNGNVSIGENSQSSGDDSVAIGHGSRGFGKRTVSVGDAAVAKGFGTTAVGGNAFVYDGAEESVALGGASVATQSNVVSFGHKTGDIKSYTIEGNPDNYDLQTYDSDYYRRLINIADGIDSNDAVTVGQLNSRVKYDDSDKATVTLEGVRGTKLTNLKAGTLSRTSTDAVIGSQLYATNQNIAGFAQDINRNKANITTLNQSVTDALTSVSAVSDLVDTIDQLKADTSLNNLTAQGKAVINTAAADAVQAYMAEYGGPSNSNGGALGVGITGKYYGINSSSGSNQNGENATGTNSIAIGKNTQAGGSFDTIAIGLNAVSKGDGSVVIGKGARADVNSDDTELYDHNFGQVILGYEAVTTGDNNKGTVAISSFAEGYDTFQSIAIGHSSFVTGNYSIAMGAGAGGKNVMDREESQYTDISKGYFRMDGKAGTGYESISIGHDSLGFSDNSIAIGDHSFVGSNNSVAIGTKSSVGSSSDNVVSFGHKAGDNYFAWDKIDEDYVGVYTDDLKRRLINIEDGIDDNDAVTVGQLNGRVKYDTSDKATVTLEGTRGTKLTNLKAAALSRTSTDAVIGSQLYATNQNIVGFAQDINRNKANITSLNQSVTDALTSVSAVSDLVDMVDQLKADTSLNNLTAQGKNVIANEAVNAVQAYMAQHGGITSVANEPTKPRLMALTAPALTADPEQGITQEDLDAKADISYVDNALANKANISDVETLSTTVSNLETNLTGSINALDSCVSDTESALSAVVDTLDTKADKDSVYTKEETDTKLADKADKADLDLKADKSDLDTKADKDAGNIDIQAWADKLGVGEIAEGNTGLVNGGTVYNTIKKLGNNNMVQSDGQTISIGKDDTADSVSIAKADGTGRVLRGVLVDPEDDTSAANVGYVNAVADSLADGINNGFARIDDKINKTGAGAAALANLHPVDTDGDTKLNIAAAIGKYHGSTAGALGVFYKPSDRVVMNISSTVGNNDTMFGAGISVAVDKPIANGLSKVQMAKTISAQADEISAIKQSMVEERKIMMNEILLLRKEVQELKAQKK